MLAGPRATAWIAPKLGTPRFGRLFSEHLQGSRGPLSCRIQQLRAGCRNLGNANPPCSCFLSISSGVRDPPLKAMYALVLKAGFSTSLNLYRYSLAQDLTRAKGYPFRYLDNYKKRTRQMGPAIQLIPYDAYVYPELPDIRKQTDSHTVSVLSNHALAHSLHAVRCTLHGITHPYRLLRLQ